MCAGFFKQVVSPGRSFRYVALQRDEFLGDKFMLDVSIDNPDMLVFLDESGADNMLRYLYICMQTCTEIPPLIWRTCVCKC